jgi:hypothetical protein
MEAPLLAHIARHVSYADKIKAQATGSDFGWRVL